MTIEITDFTIDSSTNIGKLRYKIGDINVGRPLFSDAELTLILSETGDRLNLASVECLTRLRVRSDKLQLMFNAKDQSDLSKWHAAIDRMIDQFQKTGEVAVTNDTQTWDELDDTTILNEIDNSDFGR